MAKLSASASQIASKYVTISSNKMDTNNRPKRGLQAEVNKIEAIRRVIGTKDFDSVELFRFRATVNSLLQTIDFKMQEG